MAKPDKGNDKPDKDKPGKDKPGKDKPRTKPKGKLYDRATNDIQVAYQPSLDEIQRQIEQLNLDYQNQSLGMQSVFGGAQDILEGLPGQYQSMTSGIPDQYNQAVGEFTGMFSPQGMPQSEVGAALGMAGALGENTFSDWASGNQRAAMYNQSSQRENQLSARYGQLNLQQNMEDALQQAYNQQQRLNENMTPAILSRMDTLRDQQQQNRQDNAFNALLQDLIGAQLGGGNTGPGGPGGPGGGNGETPSPYGDESGTVSDQVAAYYSNPGLGKPAGWWDQQPGWLTDAIEFAGANTIDAPYHHTWREIMQTLPNKRARRWLRQPENRNRFYDLSGWTSDWFNQDYRPEHRDNYLPRGG